MNVLPQKQTRPPGSPPSLDLPSSPQQFASSFAPFLQLLAFSFLPLRPFPLPVLHALPFLQLFPPLISFFPSCLSLFCFSCSSYLLLSFCPTCVHDGLNFESCPGFKSIYIYTYIMNTYIMNTYIYIYIWYDASKSNTSKSHGTGY